MGGGRYFLTACLVVFAPVIPALGIGWAVAHANGRRLRYLRIAEITVPFVAAIVCALIALLKGERPEPLAAGLFVFAAIAGFSRPYGGFRGFAMMAYPEAISVYMYCGFMLSACALAIDPLTHWM